MFVPDFIVSQIYLSKSLRNSVDGVAFTLRNGFGPFSLGGLTVKYVEIEGRRYEPDTVIVQIEGRTIPLSALADEDQLALRHGAFMQVIIPGLSLAEGPQNIAVCLGVKEGRELTARVTDWVGV